MAIVITTFADSPDRGEGLARDMRVRWALEEVGLPYEVRFVALADLKGPAHRALSPFGAIPTFEEDGLVLFESGAIVLHVAQAHAGLLPEDPRARARATAWMFAALSTVEPPILEREVVTLLDEEAPFRAARQPLVEARVRARLADLAARLGDGPWLDGAFSAGDLLMVHAILRLDGSGLIEERPPLAAYVARARARPAFVRAWEAQRADFVRTTGEAPATRPSSAPATPPASP